MSFAAQYILIELFDLIHSLQLYTQLVFHETKEKHSIDWFAKWIVCFKRIQPRIQ